MNQLSRRLRQLAIAAAVLGGSAGLALAQAPSPAGAGGGPADAQAVGPAGPAETTPGTELPVLYVTSVEVLRTVIDPKLDIVRVTGLTGSQGWSDPQLVPTFSGKPLDDILDLQFIATMPTQSARNSTIGGIVSPSDFAVLRLIAMVKYEDCSTGRSWGVAPRKMRSRSSSSPAATR